MPLPSSSGGGSSSASSSSGGALSGSSWQVVDRHAELMKLLQAVQAVSKYLILCYVILYYVIVSYLTSSHDEDSIQASSPYKQWWCFISIKQQWWCFVTINGRSGTKRIRVSIIAIDYCSHHLQRDINDPLLQAPEGHVVTHLEVDFAASDAAAVEQETENEQEAKEEA
jgi:hypothetical protein